MIKLLILIVSVSILGFSCTKKTTENTNTGKVKPKVEKTTDIKKEKTKEKVKKLDSKLVKDEFYEVTFNFKEEITTKDELIFAIKAVPKKDRHINDGFPTSLAIESTCFKFNKKKYKNNDAKKLDEKSLEFELKTKCETKGKQELKGNLRFGYCTDAMCYTYDSPFKFNINVK